jgi:hypothetical protein
MNFNKHDIKNKKLSEADLANRKMGDNDLQGDDQLNVRNQRHAVPDTKLDTDGIVESLEKLDKDVRARRDLGKGNRSSK